MSAFIFAFNKTSAPIWEKSELDVFLPRPSKQLKVYEKGRSVLYHLIFDTALYRDVEDNQNFTIAIEGYISDNNRRMLPNMLLSTHEFDVTSFPDAFCSVAFTNDNFGFYSSITGIDQLFYYEDERGVYVTNRHNLLGIVCKSLTLRENSFAWMCSRGHIGDHGTYWNEINRSRPGEKYFYDGELKTIKGRKTALFEQIKNDDAMDYLKSVADDFALIFNGIEAKKSISLTGGKDSRAILGLLDYSNSIDNIRVSTTGHLFSPDVMSAQCLTQKLGITNHRINRPKLVITAMDYAERIANELLFDFTGKSLADIGKFSFTNELILGGHEAGIKSPKNDRGLKEFINAREKWWCDDRRVLNITKRKEITQAYADRLESSLADVPVSCYDKIEGIDLRISNRNSPNITGSHLGSSQMHPFYDGRIIKAVCGLSEELLTAQFIPYYFTSLSNVDLVNEPFANDGWPQTLTALIDSNKALKKIQKIAPFRFREEHPSEKSFGLFSWRLELCDISSQRLIEYIKDNNDFFCFLDFEKSKSIIEKEGSQKNFREMQIHLGILKAAIVHYLKDDLFSFENKKLLVSRIKDFFISTSLQESTDENELIDKLESKLLEYEESIAKLTNSVREFEECDQLDINKSRSSKQELVLNKVPIKLGIFKTGQRITITGVSNSSLTSRKLLLFLEESTNVDISSLNYSSKLKGYFKYFSIAGNNINCNLELKGEMKDTVDLYISTWGLKEEELPIQVDIEISIA